MYFFQKCVHMGLFSNGNYFFESAWKNDILRKEIKVVCKAKFLSDLRYIISCVILVSQMCNVTQWNISELLVTFSCYFWLADLLQLKIYNVC